MALLTMQMRNQGQMGALEALGGCQGHSWSESASCPESSLALPGTQEPLRSAQVCLLLGVSPPKPLWSCVSRRQWKEGEAIKCASAGPWAKDTWVMEQPLGSGRAIDVLGAGSSSH